MKNALLLILVFTTVLLKAQDNPRFLIKAGKLFDSETGQFKTGMSILVNGSAIEAVKADKELTAREQGAYQLIDLSRYTVLPGLIDCHTHLLNREVLHPGNELPGLDMARVLTMGGDAYRAVYGSVKAKAYLEAGITSVQDLGNSGQFADIALQKAINEGLVPGPRMTCAGQGLSTAGGQLPDLIFKHQHIVNDEYRIIKGADDAVQAVRENITQGATVIKIFSNNTPNNTMLSVEEIKAITQEAHRYNIRVTAHATNNRAVYNAILGGVDGIEHGYRVADTTLELMARKKVVLVPTDCDSVIFAQFARLSWPGDEGMNKEVMDFRKQLGARLQRALKKGVMIAFGSDDYIDFKLPFAEASKRTLIGYHEQGVSISQVLQFATINAARQVNRDGKLGILKQGFWADIIAVDSDLETNINAIMQTHFVMKDGKVLVNK
ncbi:MAG TPA: amidohydrolase family protein [Niastella sp.]